MNSTLDHIAILVRSIEQTLKANSIPKEHINETKEFPSIGTKEVYIGSDQELGRILLMEATGEGPYYRALQKRGPGIHHIAITVPSLSQFVNNISSSGWLLHPISLEYSKHKQIYVCRPGNPTLFEVIESSNTNETESYYIHKVQFPFTSEKLLHALGCEMIEQSEKTEPSIHLYKNNELFNLILS